MATNNFAELKERQATVDTPSHPSARASICVPLFGGELPRSVRKSLRFYQVYTSSEGMVQKANPTLSWEVYAEHNDTIAQDHNLVLAQGVPGKLIFDGFRLRWEADLSEHKMLQQKGGLVRVDLPINENTQMYLRFVADRICIRLRVGTRQRGNSNGLVENTLRGFVLMNTCRTGRRAINIINGIRKKVIKEVDDDARRRGEHAPLPAEGIFDPNHVEPKSDDSSSDEEMEDTEEYGDEYGYWDEGN